MVQRIVICDDNKKELEDAARLIREFFDEIKNVIYDEISTIEFYSSNDVIKELNNNFYGMILQSEIKKVERLREYKDE